jgi:hypothetical protein
MTVGVWLVPVALLAASVFLWASAWFEAHVLPPDSNAEGHQVEAADASFADTDQMIGIDDERAAEPNQPPAPTR